MAEAEIKEKINDKLAGIADPHMGISIVEMGLIQNIEVDEANKKAVITVKPTNPMCMSVANIAMAVRIEAEKLDEIDKAEINVIDHMMSNEVNECTDIQNRGMTNETTTIYCIDKGMIRRYNTSGFQNRILLWNP